MSFRNRFFAPMLLASAFFQGCGLIADDPGSGPGVGGVVDDSCDGPSHVASALAVEGTRELGVMVRPESIRTFSGGASGRVGHNILWTFAEATLRSPAEDGALVRTAVGGLSTDAAPFSTKLSLDSKGAPRELIAFDDEERAFNASHAPSERYVLWPTGVVSVGADQGVVFYGKLVVRPGFLDMTHVASGFARLREGELSAYRDVPPLFVKPDPGFDLGPVVDSDYLYVYSCGGAEGCKVARALRHLIGERPAWRVWDGATWNVDLSRGAELFSSVPGDLSVSWNAHLHQYLAVHTEAFTDRVVARTAPRPEGPWSGPVTLFHTAGNGWAGKEHAALAKSCGKVLTVSHYLPKGADSLDGELHLVEVTLR